MTCRAACGIHCRIGRRSLLSSFLKDELRLITKNPAFAVSGDSGLGIFVTFHFSFSLSTSPEMLFSPLILFFYLNGQICLLSPFPQRLSPDWLGQATEKGSSEGRLSPPEEQWLLPVTTQHVSPVSVRYRLPFSTFCSFGGRRCRCCSGSLGAELKMSQQQQFLHFVEISAILA